MKHYSDLKLFEKAILFSVITFLFAALLSVNLIEMLTYFQTSVFNYNVINLLLISTVYPLFLALFEKVRNKSTLFIGFLSMASVTSIIFLYLPISNPIGLYAFLLVSWILLYYVGFTALKERWIER